MMLMINLNNLNSVHQTIIPNLMKIQHVQLILLDDDYQLKNFKLKNKKKKLKFRNLVQIEYLCA